MAHPSRPTNLPQNQCIESPLFPGRSRAKYEQELEFRKAINDPDMVPHTVSDTVDSLLMQHKKPPVTPSLRIVEVTAATSPAAPEAPPAPPPAAIQPLPLPDDTASPPQSPTPLPPTPTTPETPTAQPPIPAPTMAAHRATEAAEFKAKLLAAETRNSTLASHASRLENQCRLLQTQVEELNGELRDLEAAKHADTLEIMQLREQLQDAMMAKTANTNLIEAQLQLARAELTVAKEQLDTGLAEKHSLTQELITAKIEAATATERLVQVEHEYGRTSEQASQQAECLAQLQKQLQDTRTSHHVQLGNVAASAERVEAAKAQLEAADKEAQRLKLKGKLVDARSKLAKGCKSIKAAVVARSAHHEKRAEDEQCAP